MINCYLDIFVLDIFMLVELKKLFTRTSAYSCKVGPTCRSVNG
jgi:hypothetical protein